MSGMFWHNNYAPSVQIDSLLSREDITLSELMDAEDILQECKSQNKKLIDYLTRPDILEELVNLITEEPSQDVEERMRYKYSNVACELLTCDVPILAEKLAVNEELLSKLYSFIDKEEPLNPLLASFFSKTMHALLRRASDQNWFSHQFVCLQVLESLKSRKNCIDLLLGHVETSAIMDLILILLTKIEGDEMRQNILNWLDEQQLVQRLVKLLSPSSDPKKHTNASQLLCDIVKSPRVEADKKPDPILQTLQSEETIKLILDTILNGEKVESSIVGGVRILINLIGQKEIKTTDSTETYGAPFTNFVEDELREKFALTIIYYMDIFNELLLNPPEKPSVQTTAGFLEKPFGRSRLYILKLYVSLLSTENFKVFENFAESDTFNILLDLFFQYAWNNFLHTQVQQCLSIVIKCDCPKNKETMYSHIFVECRLTDRILEAWENNDDNTLNKKNGIRQGYMGHLINIANEVVAQSEASNVLIDFLKWNVPRETLLKWENFVKTKLDEIDTIQKLALGEPPEAYSSGSDEYASFPQDSYSQEAYTTYQEHSSVSVFADDDYNFRMEKFNEGEDTFQNAVDQLNHQSFNLMDDDYEKKQDLFNKICDEKKFDNVSGSDQWGQTNDFSIDKSGWLSKKKHDNSSSSDEDEDEDIQVETSDPWNSINLCAQSESGVSIWNAVEPVEQTGWANFDNFNSVFNTEVTIQPNLGSNGQDEVPKVPITNKNTCPSENISGNDSNSSKSEEKVEINDIKIKTEETNVSSVSNSDCIKTCVNISDSNANLTVLEKEESDSKNIDKNLEQPCLPEASSENTTDQIVMSATDNVSSTTNAVPEPSQ